MDVLALILQTVRATIEASGAPPDDLQGAIGKAERHLRSSLGGSMHHISRAPQVTTKARIIELAQADTNLSAGQISQRVGVTDRHVRRVLSMLRR